jgi:hypothetical protein
LKAAALRRRKNAIGNVPGQLHPRRQAAGCGVRRSTNSCIVLAALDYGSNAHAAAAARDVSGHRRIDSAII